MTKEQFNEEINADIKRLVDETTPKITMVDFLNKHANGDSSILGYWYKDWELEGLTDYQILLKCWFLVCNKSHILYSVFKDKYCEFEDDVEYLTKTLKFNKKEIKNKVWKN